MSLWRRLRYLLPSSRKAEERDLQEELESLRTIAGPGELGNLTMAAENARSVWGWSWLDGIQQDFRFGFRALIRHRRVTAVALLSLALGIGANTLVFSFVNTLLWRALPYPEPDRLVLIASAPPSDPSEAVGLARSDCSSLSAGASIFEHFGCYTDPVSASIADHGTPQSSPEYVRGWQLSAGAAQALDIHPLLGRWFTEADERESAGHILLISSRLWQRRFAGDRDVIGKDVRLNGEPATIIGVLPDNFEFLDLYSDYCIPFRDSASGRQSSAHVLGGLGRLRSGMNLSAAKSELAGLATRLAEASPETNKGWGLVLKPLERGEGQNPLAVLQGVVAFVLLIACLNVAGLLLAQGRTDQKEVAVRAALGCSRWRICRQLLAHCVLLSLGGCALGLVVGVGGVRIVKSLLPAGLAHGIYETQLDMSVVLFTLGISVLSSMVVGIAPAFKVSQAEPLGAMRENGRSLTSGVYHQRLRSTFVAGQIALALVLLVGGGLMLNSLVRMAHESLGFDSKDLLTIAIELPESGFRRPTDAVLASGALEMQIDAQMYQASEQIIRNLAIVPGINAASGIAIYPPFSGALNMPVRIEGKEISAQDSAQFLPILPDYFKTLEVAVVQGREFTLQDRSGTLDVAVINQAMAQRYWPNQNAIGKRLQVASPLLPDQPMREVVGVVGEVKQYPGQQSRPQLYVPYLQLPPRHDERLSDGLRRITFIVRTAQPIAGISPAIKAAVGLADNSQAISSIRTMQNTAFGNQGRRNVHASLFATFGIIAVLLAAVGVYGVMAQAVSQRTKEIGIRMALGADSTQVRYLVIRQGGFIIGIGLLAGIIGALGLTRIIRSNLFGVGATDPLTFTAAAALLGAIAFLACYLPARRASRVDPMLALRNELSSVPHQFAPW